MFVSFLILVLIFVPYSNSSSCDGMLIYDVKQLRFYKNVVSTARRTSPAPQLQCVGWWFMCVLSDVDGAYCFNTGGLGTEVQWECWAKISIMYRLSSVNVTCEGCRYPDDPYVLKDSCRLRYTIGLSGTGAAFYLVLGSVIFLSLIIIDLLRRSRIAFAGSNVGYACLIFTADT